MHPIERVRQILSRNGLHLTDEQSGALRLYGELLGAWNAKLNLISRREAEDLWSAHILHSLAPWLFLRLPAAITVLDLGTGGGLPGVPLAILRSDLRVVLLDSVAKKTAALAEIVRELGLGNAEVLTGRAEEHTFQQTFRCDVVVARAVASLVELIRWSRPLLSRQSPGTAQTLPSEVSPGTLIAMKGGDLSVEIHQARIKIGDVPIREMSLTFDGSHEAGLVEKKILLVTLG